jgi:hypothetical protein
MFGRGRSRREYRVYAEDRFLGGEDLAFEDASLDEASPDGWPEDASTDDGRAPLYTAPPRRLPGTIASRTAGIAVLAAVAMVLSAIVVHALRPVVEGGGASRPPAAAPTATGGISAARGVRRRGGGTHPARVASIRSRVAVAAGPPHAGRSRRIHPDMVAEARAPAGASSAGEEATAPASDDVAAVGSAPAGPEFGFER